MEWLHDLHKNIQEHSTITVIGIKKKNMISNKYNKNGQHEYLYTHFN